MKILFFSILLSLSNIISFSASAITRNMDDQESSILYAHTDQFQAVGRVQKQMEPMDYLVNEFETIMKALPLEIQRAIYTEKGTASTKDFIASFGDKISWTDDLEQNLRKFQLQIEDDTGITVNAPLGFVGSGTLIDHTYMGFPDAFQGRVVLTCAHNLHFDNESCDANALTFSLKTSPTQKFTDQYEQRKIISVFYPSEYNSSEIAQFNKVGDIAVVVLDRPYSNIRPLRPSDLPLDETLGKSITVVGFPSASLLSSTVLVDDGMKRAGQQVVNLIEKNRAKFFLRNMSYYTYTSLPLDHDQLITFNKITQERDIRDFKPEDFFKSKRVALEQYLLRQFEGGEQNRLLLTDSDKQKATEHAISLASLWINELRKSYISFTALGADLRLAPEIPSFSLAEFPYESEKLYTIVKKPQLPILPLVGMSGGPALIWDYGEQRWTILGVAISGVSVTGTLDCPRKSGRLIIKRSDSETFKAHVAQLSSAFEVHSEGKDIRSAVGNCGYTHVNSYRERFRLCIKQWLETQERAINIM